MGLDRCNELRWLVLRFQCHPHIYHVWAPFGFLTLTASQPLSAGRLGWDEERVRVAAQELVDSLSSMGRIADAATIAAGYLGDADTAVALLARAREWREVGIPIA